MTKVEKIEQAISNLGRKDVSELREWFQEFDASQWDEQIEKDVTSGKLDNLAKNALNDFKNGNYKEL